MHSLGLNELTFTAEQISILRALGEYRGKQAIFFKQSHETLKSLQLVAKIGSFPITGALHLLSNKAP